MADVLSSREREAIAAFPKDRITRVPAGVSGLPEYTYEPTSAAAGRIVGGRTARDVVASSHRIRVRGMRFRGLKRREREARP